MEKIKLIIIFTLLFATVFIFAQQGAQKSESIEKQEINSSNNTGTQKEITAQQNTGEEKQIQQTTQSKVKTGNYTTSIGEQIQIKEQTNNKIQITSKNIKVETELNITTEKEQNKTKLRLKLSNGLSSELKIMPDQASETAMKHLRLKVCSEENNCQIELKEVGQGNEIKAAYEIQAQKQVKVLGLFQTQMQVKTQINAENGEMIKTERPWWAFLTTED